MLVREWYVRAYARETGYKSEYGPFGQVKAAALFVDENRPADKWKEVKITSRVVDT